MAQIPKGLESPPLAGLTLWHDGKVRGTYRGLSGRDDLLLQFVSSRISIFNFILKGLVAQKGEILTAMTVFWLTQVLKNFPSHLVAFGSGINEYLPKELKGDPDLLSRALVIKRLDLAPIEAIVRGYLTGSGWKSYQNTGQCYGHILPPGLWDGAKLPCPIFTPTEKSDDDPPIAHEKVVGLYGGVMERSALQAYMQAAEYALSHGIILADNKLEMTASGVIGDEVLTPDASRFWDKAAWDAAAQKQKSPPSLDKEYTRQWGKTEGIDQLDPTNPEHIAQVEALGLSAEVAETTAAIYRYIFWRLTGKKLERFQDEVMGISDARPPKVKIAVLIGSKSDLPQCNLGLEHLKGYVNDGLAEVELHVLSCHRNFQDLLNFVKQTGADIFVPGAGWAAQLPAMLKVVLRLEGKEKPVIGVAFSNEDQKKTLAAQLSITELPDNPLILDKDGQAFTGSQGFFAACDLAVNGEFLPAKPSAGKPAEFNLPF